MSGLRPEELTEQQWQEQWERRPKRQQRERQQLLAPRRQELAPRQQGEEDSIRKKQASQLRNHVSQVGLPQLQNIMESKSKRAVPQMQTQQQYDRQPGDRFVRPIPNTQSVLTGRAEVGLSAPSSRAARTQVVGVQSGGQHVQIKSPPPLVQSKSYVAKARTEPLGGILRRRGDAPEGSAVIEI